jgi:glycosyltransferase involved in cell wall biosynthesis
MGLRLLITSSTYLPYIGGWEIYLERFSKELACRGFKVTILTRWNPGTKRYETVNGVTIKRVPLKEALKSFNIFALPLSLSNTKLIAKGLALLFLLSISSGFGFLMRKKALIFPIYWYLTLLKEIRYDQSDIIHSFSFIDSGFISCLMGKMLKKKVIVDEVSNPLGLYKIMSSRLRFALIKFVIEGADLIYVGSRKLLQILNIFGIDSGKVKIRKMPIDVDQFRPADDKIESKKEMMLEDSFVLLYVGRLAPFKNVESLIKAMPAILERIPNAKLLIVGDGKSRGYLEKQAKLLKVSDNVIFYGLVQPKEVHKYYKVADVFVSLSKQPRFSGENYSHPDATTIEAMASGVPIVSPADLLVIDDGPLPKVDTMKIVETGIIINPHSINALVDAITFLYENPDIRCRMAKNCRAAVSKFNWSSYMDEMVNMYNSLCKNS